MSLAMADRRGQMQLPDVMVLLYLVLVLAVYSWLGLVVYPLLSTLEVAWGFRSLTISNCHISSVFSAVLSKEISYSQVFKVP